jgi:hypothetical protein
MLVCILGCDARDDERLTDGCVFVTYSNSNARCVGQGRLLCGTESNRSATTSLRALVNHSVGAGAQTDSRDRRAGDAKHAVVDQCKQTLFDRVARRCDYAHEAEENPTVLHLVMGTTLESRDRLICASPSSLILVCRVYFPKHAATRTAQR